jgi:DNA-binding transcriptional LysR family regulator
MPWKLTRGKEIWEGVPPGRLASNSIGVIQQLLLDGAGIGALPNYFTQEDVRQKRLVRVLPEWCFPSVSVWAVMPMRRFLPAKTRVFLAHLEQYMVKDQQA